MQSSTVTLILAFCPKMRTHGLPVPGFFSPIIIVWLLVALGLVVFYVVISEALERSPGCLVAVAHCWFAPIRQSAFRPSVRLNKDSLQRIAIDNFEVHSIASVPVGGSPCVPDLLSLWH